VTYGVCIVKPTRCTILSSLLNITLHVADGLSVHHQESKTVHTASGICHTEIPEMDKIAIGLIRVYTK